MAKRNHDPGFQNMTCNKCGAKAHTKPGSQHRRCSAIAPTLIDGQPMPAPIRSRHDNLPGGKRGTWATSA